MSTTGMNLKTAALMSALALSLGLGGAGCTGSVDDDGRGGPGTGQPGGKTGPGGSTPGGSTPGGSTPGGSTPGGSTPGGSNNPGGKGNPVQPGDVPPAPSSQLACPNDGKDTTGRRMLRRLTTAELDATVRAAFGLDQTQWAGPVVPPDPSSLDGFSNNVDRLTVGPEYARGILETGRTVAKVVSSAPLVTKLLPCSNTTVIGSALQPCAQTFITTYAPRLYRRPLTPAENMRYIDLWNKVGRTDVKVFVHWATLTMLQSPRVLYRSEVGKADAARFKLTPYEVASALSYTYTGAPPTPELLQQAAANGLQTAEQVEAAAKALVYDATGKVKPAFAAMIGRFMDDWAGLSTLSNLKKDAQAFPDFNQEIQQAMAEESRQFINAALFEEKGTAATLLTAPYTFIDARLSKFYGIPAAGAGYTKVARPPGWGVGLLSQGSLLAVESHSVSTSPTKRGYFVRTRLLCASVPPPPPVVGDLPPPSEGTTTRQRYEELHLADAACKGCHTIFDPIGFGFEKLDASGRFRAKEGRFDIDDSGVITGTSAGDIKYQGPTELAAALAKLPEVSSCLGSYLAAYAFGVSQENSSCLVRSALKELEAGTLSLADFYVRMARSDHFRLRQQ